MIELCITLLLSFYFVSLHYALEAGKTRTALDPYKRPSPLITTVISRTTIDRSLPIVSWSSPLPLEGRLLNGELKFQIFLYLLRGCSPADAKLSSSAASLSPRDSEKCCVWFLADRLFAWLSRFLVSRRSLLQTNRPSVSLESILRRQGTIDGIWPSWSMVSGNCKCRQIDQIIYPERGCAVGTFAIPSSSLFSPLPRAIIVHALGIRSTLMIKSRDRWETSSF